MINNQDLTNHILNDIVVENYPLIQWKKDGVYPYHTTYEMKRCLQNYIQVNIETPWLIDTDNINTTIENVSLNIPFRINIDSKRSGEVRLKVLYRKCSFEISRELLLLAIESRWKDDMIFEDCEWS